MTLAEVMSHEWLEYGGAAKIDPQPPPCDIRALVESSGLTPQQVRAALLLSTGASISSAARSVKATRTSLSGWLHHHEPFKALYFRLIEDERAELRQTMLMVSRLAIRALVAILTSPGAHPGATVRAAHPVLRAARIIDVDVEAENTEPSIFVIGRQNGNGTAAALTGD